MEQEIHITLRFDIAIGKVNLNEIVYRLKPGERDRDGTGNTYNTSI